MSTGVVEPEPVKKLRLRAVAVRIRGSVVAKMRQFLWFKSNFLFFNTNWKEKQNFLFFYFTKLKFIFLIWKKMFFSSRAGSRSWHRPHNLEPGQDRTGSTTLLSTVYLVSWAWPRSQRQERWSPDTVTSRLAATGLQVKSKMALLCPLWPASGIRGITCRKFSYRIVKPV